jgi:hypothetical protein
MGNKNSLNAQKTFNLYYNGTKQNLVVYEGTQKDEINSSIIEILNIPANEKIIILNENGYPVVLSSYLPDGIQLFIEIKKTFTQKVSEEKTQIQIKNKVLNGINWNWNFPSNTSHKLKNDKLTVYQQTNQTLSHCYGNLIMEKGIYYFELIFENLWCCCLAGIGPVDEIYKKGLKEKLNEDDERNINTYFLNNIDFHSLWNANDSHNKGPVHAGFYVNCDKNLLVIVDHQLKIEKKRINYDAKWKKIAPLVYFKHEMQITINGPCTKSLPEFIQD